MFNSRGLIQQAKTEEKPVVIPGPKPIDAATYKLNKAGATIERSAEGRIITFQGCTGKLEEVNGGVEVCTGAGVDSPLGRLLAKHGIPFSSHITNTGWSYD